MRYSARFYGFTLVELLIVISIIAIVTGAMIPGFSKYIDSQNVRQAQEQVKSDLRTVQNNALAGVMALTTGVEYWGINYTSGNNTYKIFTSSNADACPPTGDYVERETSEKLNGDVEVVHHDGCIFFSLDTGDAYYPGGNPCDFTNCSIVVGLPSAATGCRAVEVNAPGLMQRNDSHACI